TNAESSEDTFKPPLQPRRLKRVGGGQSALHLRQVRAWLHRGQRAKRNAVRRFPRLAVPPAALQRSVVKVRYVANRSRSAWRAHGRYLAREGAQQAGRPGLGFDADTD